MTEERLRKIEADIAGLKAAIPDCLLFASEAATLVAGGGAGMSNEDVALKADELRGIVRRIRGLLGLPDEDDK